jgi:glutamate racemase
MGCSKRAGRQREWGVSVTNAFAPIGVFDSGVGGLTVYRALREALPHEDFVYLGDTARLPYGTKGKDTVERYTVNAARILCGQGIKFLVVACNTASAQALDGLQRDLPGLPYCGVIAAGAEAAVKATRTGTIAVLATEGTARSGVYADVIHSLKKDAEVQVLACNLLVALAEEGWCDGDEAEAVVGRYLAMLEPGYDTLLLGCTHFPLLAPVLRKLVPGGTRIVDSATVTAQSVAGLIAARGLANPQTSGGRDAFLVTDLPARFARLGQRFLGQDIAGKVTLTGFGTDAPEQSGMLNRDSLAQENALGSAA